MKLHFFKKSRRGAGEVDTNAHGYFYPSREWAIGLLAAVSLFVGGVSYTAYDFYVQFVAEPTIQISDEKVVNYRKAEVVTTAREIEEKQKTFEQLRAAAAPRITLEESSVSAGEEAVASTTLVNDGVGQYTEQTPNATSTEE